MPVNSPHPEHAKYSPQWKLVNDCIEGSKTIKAEGETYLPKPNPDDISTENTKRYDAYKQRANFVNFTGHTKKGMVGMVFRKATKIELDTNLEYLKDNANGGGLTLDQTIRRVLDETLATGRYGLLTDYPAAEKGLTKAKVKARGLQANILCYTASRILNWRTTVIDGIKKLSLVVLAEDVEKIDADGFSSDKVTHYRVLKLENGVYIQEMWDEDQEIISTMTPTKFSGGTWDEIPFTFVGSENNDEPVDEAPLYDIAEINISHYMNSADYEESSFMVGQPTTVLTGLTEHWVKEVLKGKIAIGSLGAITLPVESDAKLLQAEPNQMPSKGMEMKEAQMIKVGAKLIQDTGKGAAETAEGAKIRFAGETSQLAGIVGNITAAIMQCLTWAGEYMNSTGENIITINDQFYDISLDAQQVMSLIQLADRGDIGQDDVRDLLRKSGWLNPEKTDDDIDGNKDDTGGGLMLTDGDDTKTGEPAIMQTDPALLELLKQLAEAQKQTFIPAGEGKNLPSIVVEAPVITVEIPENMVVVTVEQPAITVEAPDITVEAPNITIEGKPVIINQTDGDKKIDIKTDGEGNIIGADVTNG